MKGWVKGLIYGLCIGIIIFIILNAFFLLSNNPNYQNLVNKVWYKNIPSLLGFCFIGMLLGSIIGLIFNKK